MSEEPIDTALLAGFSPVEPQRQKCLPSAVKASQVRAVFLGTRFRSGGRKMIFSQVIPFDPTAPSSMSILQRLGDGRYTPDSRRANKRWGI